MLPAELSIVSQLVQHDFRVSLNFCKQHRLEEKKEEMWLLEKKIYTDISILVALSQRTLPTLIKVLCLHPSFSEMATAPRACPQLPAISGYPVLGLFTLQAV